MPTTRLRTIGKNLLLMSLGLFIGLGAVELYLRIFQPFHFRLKGDKVDLWPGREYTVTIDNPRGLDSVIFTRRNSLGFRGPERPDSFAQRLTIIAVGGSTTEGNLLAEGKTWPDQLAQRLQQSFRQSWVNNAGISGQSTYGNLVMMKDYVIEQQPKVVLYLVGINDMGLRRPKVADDAMTVRTIDLRSAQQLMTSLAQHSEVMGLALNLYRYSKAKQSRVADHGEIDLMDIDTLPPMPDSTKARMRREHQELPLPAYEERVTQLVQLARSKGIEPVLITQPMLFGDLIDDATGVNLGNLDWEYRSGFRWELMEMYNDVVRRVGRRDSVLVIDLGRQLPKSSRYFYDNAHYTNAGAALVAEIVYRDLCPFLASKYPAHITNGCGAGDGTPPPRLAATHGGQ